MDGRAIQSFHGGMRSLAPVLILLLGACAERAAPVALASQALRPAAPAQPSPQPSSSAPAPVALSVETPEATPGGTTFDAPAGWTIVMDGSRAVLTAPEPDLHVVIVDSTESTADAAVASAWHAFRPDFKRPLKVATPRPGRHGWEETRDYEYEISPDEKLVVGASAFRKAKRWTILLIDGGTATFEKRLASTQRLGESLLPAGYVRESFAGKSRSVVSALVLDAIMNRVWRMLGCSRRVRFPAS